MTPLARLDSGVEAVVHQLFGPRSFQRRLMEMGLVPGTPVRLVRRIRIGGVLELEVRRSRLTLCTSEAENLVVVPI